MERVDIAIIGTGPAGVSASITAKVRNKSVLLIGSRELSEKMSKAHQILNYPGLPEVSGADLVAGYKKQLAGLGIEVTEKRVNAVYAMGDYFGIQVSGEIYLKRRDRTVTARAGTCDGGEPRKGQSPDGDKPSGTFCMRRHCRKAVSVYQGGRTGKCGGAVRGRVSG